MPIDDFDEFDDIEAEEVIYETRELYDRLRPCEKNSLGDCGTCPACRENKKLQAEIDDIAAQLDTHR